MGDFGKIKFMQEGTVQFFLEDANKILLHH